MPKGLLAVPTAYVPQWRGCHFRRPRSRTRASLGKGLPICHLGLVPPLTAGTGTSLDPKVVHSRQRVQAGRNSRAVCTFIAVGQQQ